MSGKRNVSVYSGHELANALYVNSGLWVNMNNMNWITLRLECFALPWKVGSQLLLTSTSSNVLLGRGSKKAFNECLGVSNVFPSAV